jgi:hypothetical protein
MVAMKLSQPVYAYPYWLASGAGEVSFRLKNQNNSKKTLSMSNDSWFSILELAEEYGWNPMGTVLPELWDNPVPILAEYELDDLDRWDGSYTSDEGQLVMFEDALNLADALERVFFEVELECAYEFAEINLPGWLERGHSVPGIGAIAAAVDFCRLGAFWIERCC